MGGVVVPVGLLVVLPGVVVEPGVPGNVLELPGVVLVLPGVVDVLPEVVSVLEPVVLEPLDDPIEPGVPLDVLVPVVVSVVPVEGLVVVSLPVVVEERGLVVVELPLRGVAGAERPSGERLREVDESVPRVPDEEAPASPSAPVVVPLLVVS